MSDTTTTRRIDYPSADDLDTRGVRDDYRVGLYLIPAAESPDGVPTVTTHVSVGTPSMPMLAHHGRWAYVGSYQGETVGASVREALESIEDELLRLSDLYRGNEWDGRNHVGQWADYDGTEHEAVRDAWDGATLRHYWTAGDWFAPAGIRWADLCREAGVDPAVALGDDWEEQAERVARIVEPMQDEEVTGTEDYAIQCAEEWRQEREDEEDEEDEEVSEVLTRLECPNCGGGGQIEFRDLVSRYRTVLGMGRDGLIFGATRYGTAGGDVYDEPYSCVDCGAEFDVPKCVEV